MKLAIFQSHPTHGNEQLAMQKVKQALAAASAAGASMIVFPELFLPGYNQPDIISMSAQVEGHAWEQQFSNLAREFKCALTIGWAEKDGDVRYNTASIFDSGGNRLAKYRKIQLYGPQEKALFSAGDDYCVLSYQGTKIALLICYDIEFAHHVREVARHDVELILVPTANPMAYRNVADHVVPTRALENALTIAYVNYCGTENGLTFSGGSSIVGPDGNFIAQAGTAETLLICDVPVREMYPSEALSTQASDSRKIENRVGSGT